MADYPFNLHGAKTQSSGGGQKDGDTFKSREFELKPGIVYAEIKHHGSGDFKLEFVPMEGISRGVARATALSGTAAARAATGATGAAIGSIIVPFAGTIVGAAVGGAAGRFVGEKVGDAISGAMSPSTWTPVDGKGQCYVIDAVRVWENDDHSLPSGKYRLEVKSQSEWSCRFIQPDLGQSDGPLADDWGDTPAGAYVLGPYKAGARPLLANFRHNGGGGFFFKALAVDGMHEYTYSGDGQFIVEGIQTDIRAGKEYLLIVSSDGEWNFAFTEGY